MAIVVKDANNSDNSLKTTYDAVNEYHIPHHYVDGTTSVSGSVVVESGLIGISGTISVSGSFPSGVQYTEGDSPSAGTKTGTLFLTTNDSGNISGLYSNPSGHLYTSQNHPHSSPEKFFNAVGTISGTSSIDVYGSPSNSANRYYITSFSASNASATGLIFSMFSNVNNIFNCYIAESGGGVAMSMPSPLVCGTGESIKCSLGTASNNVLVTVQGYMDL